MSFGWSRNKMRRQTIEIIYLFRLSFCFVISSCLFRFITRSVRSYHAVIFLSSFCFVQLLLKHIICISEDRGKEAERERFHSLFLFQLLKSMNIRYVFFFYVCRWIILFFFSRWSVLLSHLWCGFWWARVYTPSLLRLQRKCIRLCYFGSRCNI